MNRLTKSNRWKMFGISIMLDSEMNFCWMRNMINNNDINKTAHEDCGYPETISPKESAEECFSSTDSSDSIGWRIFKPIFDDL